MINGLKASAEMRLWGDHNKFFEMQIELCERLKIELEGRNARIAEEKCEDKKMLELNKARAYLKTFFLLVL